MKIFPGKHLIQKMLWVCMVIITAALCWTGVYTNTTVHSIEKSLPKTLLTELNSLSTTLEELSTAASYARIARATSDPQSFRQLHDYIAKVQASIVELRDTYVINNLINASAFHAVVAPAIADIQIWLEEGVSGYAPNSPITLEIIETRIDAAFQKASALKYESQNHAQLILDSQMKRLETFQHSVTALYALILIIVISLVVVLVRQSFLINREVSATRKLSEQHDLLENLLQNLPLGIAVWDKNKNITHLNNAFTDLTGYDRSDMPRLDLWPQLAYPDPEYRRQVATHWRALDKKRSIGEYKVTCKYGNVKDIEFRATFLPDSRVINTLTDVTERNIREKALQESRKIEARSKKMESLGLLAGGVAHDLNNILSGIVSYPELLLLEMPEDDKFRKPIEIIHDSGQKASAIVQDLLTVARGVAIAKEPINLNTLVNDYLNSPDYKILKQYHPDVVLKTSLADDLFNIIGSRVHVRKILMNLISNGFEAIEKSGTVYITTANCYIDTAFQGYEDIEEGEFVMLSVADQGSGISDADLERIFEPFYSKKVMGRSGTGLGLAVVWNVVQDHYGYINVSSSSEGTTFNVYLPMTQESSLTLELSKNVADLKGNGELILVVDDISSQRLITSSILEKLGYRPQSVPSGEAAVEFIKGNQVDLVLLDMIMDPGINGRETYRRILQIRQDQKAIIVSGFAETDEVKETLDLGAHSFVKKPLKIQEIGAAIQEALQEKTIAG